ncbi:MAG: MmcQ/YjbR family DNA-binding protein [Acidobacteriota bacterium]|nr:MmcQ/YjbR family DNA-binding protein [Acidobacteriota bacterium]
MKPISEAGEEQLSRVRRICAALPGVTEKLSHGEPTFFTGGKVFAMFSDNHHNDGHVAVMVPAPPGFQAALIDESSRKYYKPPYVGVRGWIGINLNCVDDEELAEHVLEGWRMIAPRKLRANF